MRFIMRVIDNILNASCPHLEQPFELNMHARLLQALPDPTLPQRLALVQATAGQPVALRHACKEEEARQ